MFFADVEEIAVCGVVVDGDPDVSAITGDLVSQKPGDGLDFRQGLCVPVAIGILSEEKKSEFRSDRVLTDSLNALIERIAIEPGLL